jgi:hypothetical protein
MSEFGERAELSKHFYGQEDIKDATCPHVIDAAEKDKVRGKAKRAILGIGEQVS